MLSRATAAALPADCRGDAGDRTGELLVGLPPANDDAEAPDPAAGSRPHAGPRAPHARARARPRRAPQRDRRVRPVQGLGRAASRAAARRRSRSALDEIVGATAAACREWGIALVSSDVDSDGGKLILSAGAPVASPDDDDRMLHALRDVVAREWPLAVRAGVNRGPVFSADIGTPARRVWSLMGDAVNLAARVMVKAEPGEVLATPSALRRVRDDFERTPVEPFKAKGKSAPGPRRVGRPRARRAGGRRRARDPAGRPRARAGDAARRPRRRARAASGG